MIQRIQTIYLFISALVFGSLFILPIGASSQPASGFLADSKYAVNDHAALMGLAIAGAVFSFLAILLYKNRPTQMKLTYIGIILSLVFPLVAYLIFNSLAGIAADTVGFSFQPGLFLPGISLIMGFLALRSIRKDDRLVKSMDRLR